MNLLNLSLFKDHAVTFHYFAHMLFPMILFACLANSVFFPSKFKCHLFYPLKK